MEQQRRTLRSRHAGRCRRQCAARRGSPDGRVSETGQWSGYISGGCLEAAIALEAVAAIKAGKPRLLRYGKGSPYLDIRLPCGSGLDVFIQPMRDAALIEDMSERLERREPFALRIDLATGACQLQARAGSPLQSRREGSSFFRAYEPALRCLIIGSSPIAVALAELAACAGFEAEFYATDPDILPKLPVSVKVQPLKPRLPFASGSLDGRDSRISRPRPGIPFFLQFASEPLFLHRGHWQQKRARGPAGRPHRGRLLRS